MTYTPTGQRMVIASLILGLILASVEQTVVSTAMPTIVKELGGLSVYSWVFAIYMLTSTASMPLYGKLADLYGRRKMFLLGLFLFLLGSALCGLSGSMAWLIASRGIQGVGAGALMPIAFTIIADMFPPERRGKFMGMFGSVFMLSSLLGPTLGGVLVQYGHWSAIFYLNLPIGIVAYVLMASALKESIGSEKRQVDWLGAITFTGAIVATLLALVMGGEQPEAGYWTSAPAIGLLAAGLILLALFVWIESKAREPLIPLQLFRIRLVTFSGISGFFISAAIFGAIAYIPLYAQGVVGVSPSIAGYTLTPLMLASVATSSFSGRLMNRLPYRTILAASFLLMAAGFFLLSRMTAHTTVAQLVVIMIVIGLGMGAVFPTLGTAAQSAVDWRMRGVATSSNQFFRSVGGTIGVSVLGALLTQRMTSLQASSAAEADQAQQYANPRLLLDAEARAALPPQMLEALQQTFGDALQYVFAAGLAFVLLALACCLWMGSERLVQSSAK